MSEIQQMNQEPVFKSERDRHTWTMFLHLSIFAGYVAPFAGLVVPIVLWQLKKEDPIVNKHGTEVLNFMISLMIYYAIAFVLCFVLIGAFIFPILAVYNIVVSIISGIKANEGKFWPYPYIFRFIEYKENH